MTKTVRKMWTKEGVRKVQQLWEMGSSDSIAKELGVSKLQLTYMVNQMRNAGFKLAKKRRGGTLQAMLRDVLKERN